MNRHAHAQRDRADGCIAALALALVDMREKAQAAVSVAAPVRLAVHQSELVCDQSADLGKGVRVSLRHRHIEHCGVDQNRSGALIKGRVAEHASVVPPRARSTVLKMSFKRLPGRAEE